MANTPSAKKRAKQAVKRRSKHKPAASVAKPRSDPEHCEVVIQKKSVAKKRAARWYDGPGSEASTLTLWTDGSRNEGGAAVYRTPTAGSRDEVWRGRSASTIE